MSKKTKSFTASNGYTISMEPDKTASVPMTAEEWKSAPKVKAADVLPPAFFEAIEEMKKAGRPRKANKAVPVSIRIDPAVLEAYKKTGAGWQTRINDILMAHMPQA